MIKKKYIEVLDKKRCSGCTACQSACPKNCICMEADEEGFLYPKVDTSKCIQCGKCRKVCPYVNLKFTDKPDGDELALCYAAYNIDEEIRLASSSGGMFRIFADKIISEGGVVFGVQFDKDFFAEHAWSETFEGLRPYMGSKYMQSRLGTTFTQVKKFLEDGRKVLFTGCGCQIAGLKGFLGKDFDNMYCVDLICHGADSPIVWQCYLHSLFPNETIEHVNLRDKITGHSNSSIFIKGSNTTFCEMGKNNIYFRSWRYGLFTRPSCEHCPFKADNRISDITIADCWGFEKMAPEIFDDKGLSTVVLHTVKGRNLFESVSQRLVFKETSLDDVKTYNPDYIRSMPFNHKKRAAFWKDYRKHKMPFGALLKRHLDDTAFQKAKQITKKIIKRCLHLLRK